MVIVAALCCFVWRLSTVSKSLELGKLHENRKIDLYYKIGALKILNTSAAIWDSRGFCVIEFNSALQEI